MKTKNSFSGKAEARRRSPVSQQARLDVAVVGDGEAETGPLEGSWKGVKFLNPVHDRAVLPVLHLNGYKISGPTVMGRDWDQDVRKLLEAHGYDVHFVEGDDPPIMHQAFSKTL